MRYNSHLLSFFSHHSSLVEYRVSKRRKQHKEDTQRHQDATPHSLHYNIPLKLEQCSQLTQPFLQEEKCSKYRPYKGKHLDRSIDRLHPIRFSEPDEIKKRPDARNDQSRKNSNPENAFLQWKIVFHWLIDTDPFHAGILASMHSVSSKCIYSP